MKVLKVERMDHLGLIAGVIKDLRLIEKLDNRLGCEELEEISTGEAIAGMVINGLGFSDSPMSLTPEFFEDKPLELLFREGFKAEYLNRFKLGRSLDKVYEYGCDVLFSEIALEICQTEGVDMSCHHLDTTSFSVSGEYLPDEDEQAIKLTYGYSKDKRADLKQAVLEMVVSNDGGVPFVSKSWNGNESDNKIFGARLEALIKGLKQGDMPAMVVADSKLYSQENAAFLHQIPFLTRVPGTLKLEGQLIKQALQQKGWEELGNGYRGQQTALGHYGIAQYWQVFYSEAAYERVSKSVSRRQEKEKKALEKQLYHLQAKAFACQKDAERAAEEASVNWKYHTVTSCAYHSKMRYDKRGKPKADTPIKGIEWFVSVEFQVNLMAMKEEQEKGACFVLATPWSEKAPALSAILAAYKAQNVVERGFRFLKDPLFFVSSLFVKKPSRIQGLLMVMTLALMVYSIAERRLRRALTAQAETLPNQIKQPTSTPTLRWVFQILRGINRVSIQLDDSVQTAFQGINDLRRKILLLLGEPVFALYSISSHQTCSM